MKKTSLLLISVLMIALALTLCACGGAGGEESGDNGGGGSAQDYTTAFNIATETSKDSMIIGVSAEPTYMCAGYIREKIGCQVSTNIYDTLIYPEYDGSYAPGIATDWEISEDGLTYTFTIRDDVYFHNGDKMTIDDVVWTFGEWLPNTPTGSSCLIGLDKVEKIDDTHFSMHFSQFSSYIMAGLSNYNMGICCKAYYDEVGEEKFVDSPIGTGPYMLTDRKSGDYLKFKAFEDYWQGAPVIKDVTMQVIADANTAVIAMQSGQIDAYWRLAVTNKQAIEDTQGLRWEELATPSIIYIAFNMSRELPQDKNVRLAIAYALNKEEIVAGAVDGLGKVLDGNFLPDSLAEYPGPIEDYTQDYDKVRELLAASGYDENHKLTFTMYSSADAMYYYPSEIVQAQLNASGVMDVSLEKMEHAAFTEAIMTSMDYDITVFNMTYYIDPSNKLDQHFYSDSPRPYHGFNDPTIDKLGRGFTNNPNREEAVQSLHDFAQYMHDEALFLGLYQLYCATAIQDGLKGYQWAPGGEEARIRWINMYWE